MHRNASISRKNHVLSTLAMALSVLGTTVPAAATTGPATGAMAPTSALLARLPLAFEPNGAAWISRGPGYLLALDPAGATMHLYRGTREAAEQGRITESGMRLSFVGANPETTLTGADPLPGVHHRYIGRSAPKTNQPRYARAEYRQLYPGIDAVFHGRQHELEYDFEVAAGADPARIRLEVQGARSAEVDGEGNLLLHLDEGVIRQPAPIAWQDIDSERKPVSVGYRLDREADQIRFGFEIAAYDRAHPLVIDPVLSYATFFGGNGDEAFESVATDAAGNMYVAGWTGSADYPVGAAVQPAFGGWIDAVVSKINAAGDTLVYSTYLGGPLVKQTNGAFTYYVGGYDYAYDIAVDADGNAWVTGKTSSPDFPVTAGAYDTTCGVNGLCDVPATATTFMTDNFVVRLAPDGTLVYGTFLGGSNQDIPADIAVDSAGNAWVAGWTASADFPVTAGAVQGTRAGATDAYLAKLSADGSSLLYATYYGGATTNINPPGIAFTHGTGVAVDAAGNAYLAGDTNSNVLPTTPGTFRPTYNGGYSDGFVAKFSPAGALVYGTYLGGVINSDYPTAIAVDAWGNAHVTGRTLSSDYPLATPFQASPGGGGSDAFVSALDAAGANLLFSSFLGGLDEDVGTDIAVDAQGHAHISGYTESPDFPSVNPVHAYTAGLEAFLVKLDVTGSSIAYATTLGGVAGSFGAAHEIAWGVAVDDGGNAWIAGSTQATDFPVVNAIQPTIRRLYGISDAFVAKISDGAAPSCQGTGAYRLSGTTRNATGVALAGTTLILSGPGGCYDSLVSNARGSVRFKSLAAGDYTILARQAGCTFTPASTTRTLAGNQKVRFTGSCD